MSNKGIYTALSGAIAQSQRLDTIANNIANSNTTGFKKDQQTFKEYLTAFEKEPDVITVPKVTASIESFYDMNGGDRGYVDATGTYTDFDQGALKLTNNRLDVALEGKGFFEVLTGQGIRWTRNGSFRVDSQGRMVNQNGHPVLRRGEPDEDPATRIIELENSAVTISSDGSIYQNGEISSQLSVVDFENKDAMIKMGSNLYALKPNYNVERVDSSAKVHQGSLESSNVNIIREMTDMIEATRSFESTQKAIKAFDELNSRLVNDVPKLR